MKLPSKFISYKESIISHFPIVLSLLKIKNYTLIELYNYLKIDICDFVDVLTSLFALGKIKYDDSTEMIEYVI